MTRRRITTWAWCWPGSVAMTRRSRIWPLQRSEFITLDDWQYVTANPYVQAGLTWDGVAWTFRSAHASNWHPLTWLSHMLDCQFFGSTPGWHHLTNLGFHILNACLLF